MKTLCAFGVCLIASVLAQTPIDSKVLTRDIPADVLRDFPGQCFASTMCRVFNATESWPLDPFCGRATCVQLANGTLLERVEDCGIPPKENPDCEVILPEAENQAFPACCPKFLCKPGVALEFPETPQ